MDRSKIYYNNSGLFDEVGEAKLVESCTKEVAVKFIYENIVTLFGYPLNIISYKGTHFLML